MIDKAIFSLPGIRRVFAALAACALVRGLLAAGRAVALATAIVRLWEGAPLQGAAVPAGTFLICMVAAQVVLCVQDSLMERYARRLSERLRGGLLATYYDEGPSLVQRLGTGDACATALEGIDTVKSYLELMPPKLASVAIVPAVILVQICSLDWVSALIALVAYPTTLMFMVILGGAAREKAARRHAEFARMSNDFVDTVRGISTLRLFGRAHAHGGHVFRVSERFRRATMSTLSVATLSSAVLDLIATFGLAAVAIMLGFRLSDGTMGLCPALAVLILVPDYFAPLRSFAADFHATLDGRNALARVQGVLGGASRGDGPRPCGNQADKVRGGGIAPWGPGSSLEFAGISVHHEGAGADSLSNVSLEFRGFERVGVVGLSGAGKTTLAGLLAGFLDPSAGVIAVDGERTGTLRRADWQAQVAYIPQNPHVFHATLRDNIAFYLPDATERSIREAVRATGLGPLVEGLPQGLDTVVGEGARALSGGEAHRVALARALLDTRRRIWVLDEPTAHLDIETEYELKERLLPLFAGKLVIFATHRLHWARAMDRIVVLEGGRVADEGAPDEVACREGGYLRLARRINGQGMPGKSVMGVRDGR